MKRPSPIQIALLALGVAAVGSLYTPYPARLVHELRDTPQPEVTPAPMPQPPPPEPEIRIVEKIVEVPVATPAEEETPLPWEPEQLLPRAEVQLPPFPPALPERVEPGTFEHLGAFARGVNLHSTLVLRPGTTASQDRRQKEAYLLKLSTELLLPHAAEGQELLHANPDLPAVLPQFDALMNRARVSPWFHAVYLHKQNRIRKSLATLTAPLDRHNFFDTDTILELTAPETERRALWIQADMDMVSDGSDGDRLATMDEAIYKSDNYQPTTSYRWKKRTKTPNPLLAYWETRRAALLKATPKDPDAIDYANRIVIELKRYSYLLAEYDPYIVIPLTFREGKHESHRPQQGDYAVVIVGKRVIPAIVGGYGPRHKTGEASLRLGKIISPKAGVYNRPVSSLGVSYVIFPHTKEPQPGPIDYERLNTRCRELLEELGGLGPEAEYVEVPDLLAPEPPAAPNPPEPASSASPIGQ